MKIVDSNRKYILLGFVLFIIGGFLTANILAKSQDEIFIEEDLMYSRAQQLLSEGEIQEASYHANELQRRQPNSEAANYLAAVVAANEGSYSQAAILYQKTLDINPYLVGNSMFMLQFGEVLVESERYEEAKIVLIRCQESGWVPEEFPTYQERVSELLEQIENK